MYWLEQYKYIHFCLASHYVCMYDHIGLGGGLMLDRLY